MMDAVVDAIVTRINGNPTAKTVREVELEKEVESLSDMNLKLMQRQSWLEELLYQCLPIIERDELGTRTNPRTRSLIVDIKAELE